MIIYRVIQLLQVCQCRRFSPLALLVFLASACSSEPETSVPEATTPLTIHANVASTAKGKVRAAFVDADFSVGTKLGVALIKAPGETGNSIYNQSSRYALTAKNGATETWQVESGINGLFVSTQKAVAVAYYPVSTPPGMLSFSGDAAYISPSILSTNDMGNLEDYMIGGGIGVQFGDEVVKISPYENDYLVGKSNAEVSSAAPSATLELKHAFAMVSVRAINADNYYGEGKLTSFTIANSPTGSKPLKAGTIRLHDNVFTPGSQEVEYGRTFEGYHVEENAEYNDRVGFLALPASIGAGDLTISVTVDGKHYTTTNPTELVFQAGSLTRLNITVKASEIDLNTSILVEDWTSTKDQEFEIQ